MKRIIAIMLPLFLVITLSACSSMEKSRDIKNIDIEIVSQFSAQGVGEEKMYAVSNVGFVDASTTLNNTFPIYVNNYFYGQEGPLYEVNRCFEDDHKGQFSTLFGFPLRRF